MNPGSKYLIAEELNSKDHNVDAFRALNPKVHNGLWNSIPVPQLSEVSGPSRYCTAQKPRKEHHRFHRPASCWWGGVKLMPLALHDKPGTHLCATTISPEGPA